VLKTSREGDSALDNRHPYILIGPDGSVRRIDVDNASAKLIGCYATFEKIRDV
jgi:hypothetical protein